MVVIETFPRSGARTSDGDVHALDGVPVEDPSPDRRNHFRPNEPFLIGCAGFSSAAGQGLT
jgi:hypothetical protein